MGHGRLDFLKGTPGGARWVWVRSLSWRCQVSVSEVIILEVPGECEWGHYPGGVRWVSEVNILEVPGEWEVITPGGARWVWVRSLILEVSVNEVITPGGARWVWVRSLLLEVPGECEWVYQHKCIQRQSSSAGIQNCNPSSTSSLLLLEFSIVTPVLHPVFFCWNSAL